MSSILTSRSSNVNTVLNIISGIIIMVLCSQITIPMQPVPITLQTVGVTLIGLLFRPSEAALSVISYITIGVAGLPVFANLTSGFIVITGPTGGYLIGFLAAVSMISLIQQRNTKNNVILTMIAALIGTGMTMLLGVLWLATFLGISSAIQYGLLPFIMPGTVKAVITVLIVRYIGPQ